MTQLSLPSLAKINWTLKILGRRQDGFHQVETVYQTVDLQDTLHIKTTDFPAVEVKVTGRSLESGEGNLVVRAANRLRQLTGCTRGAEIHLEKRIPVGGGLGGGSSNAAMTLMALNQLWNCSLGSGTLHSLASELGSDVPFFLSGGTALGGGRGIEIHPLPDALPGVGLVLLYPRFEVSAREAYAAGEWGFFGGSRQLTTEVAETTMRRLQEALDFSRKEWSFLENDLEKILFEKYPALAKAHQRLKEHGYRHVMLCGSGSTLLGIAAGHGTAVSQASLREEGETFFCETISRRRYRKLLTDSGLVLH